MHVSVFLSGQKPCLSPLLGHSLQWGLKESGNYLRALELWTPESWENDFLLGASMLLPGWLLRSQEVGGQGILRWEDGERGAQPAAPLACLN